MTARIGAIVPAPNVMVEVDFAALCPAGASVHFARADVAIGTKLADQLQGMVDAAPAIARMLAKAEVRAIAFACTSASLFRGEGSDRAIEAAMEAASGVKAVTTARAVAAALHAVGARRVAVATPYVEWLCAAERAFLEAHGFQVTAISGLGLVKGADIHAVPLAEVVRLATAIDSAHADAVFISCTDLAAVPAIAALEATLGKPVVTSNQATFWACARSAGLRARPGFGRLLDG